MRSRRFVYSFGSRFGAGESTLGLGIGFGRPESLASFLWGGTGEAD
jgi:hypothetical protein